MREILFRGKEIFKGTIRKDYWKYGNLIQGNRTYIRPFEGGTVYEVYPETVGQYTGLKDKKGKKIFEGDIIRVSDDEGETDFCNGGIGGVEFFDGIWYVSGEPQNGLFDLNHCYYLEVIGNVHDNPELMEGKNERNTL